jgi:hypothetical protein
MKVECGKSLKARFSLRKVLSNHENEKKKGSQCDESALRRNEFINNFLLSLSHHGSALNCNRFLTNSHIEFIRFQQRQKSRSSISILLFIVGKV